MQKRDVSSVGAGSSPPGEPSSTQGQSESVSGRVDEQEEVLAPEADGKGDELTFWYPDIPQERKAQISMRQSLRVELHELKRSQRSYRENLIASTPELLAMKQQLDEIREVERSALEQHEGLADLAKTQQQRKARYDELGVQLAQLQATLKEQGMDPATFHHPVQKGCCSLHETEIDPESVGGQYLAKVEERKQVLRSLSGYAVERAEFIQALRESSSRFQGWAVRTQDLMQQIDAAVEVDPGFVQLEQQAQELQNKELYLGRVILGDDRYVKTQSSSPSSR